MVNRLELLKTILLVKPGISSSDTDQSDIITFNKGRVYSFNNEVAVSCEVPIEAEGSLKAKELIELLSRYSSAEVLVATSEKSFVIKSKNSRAMLTLNSEVRIPINKDTLSIKDWADIPEGLIDALSFCSFSAATDTTRQDLRCIHISGGLVESTDGFRITRYDIKEAKIFKTPLLIPAPSVTMLAKYELTKIARTEGWLHFKSDKDKVIISLRTAEGTYPDLDSFIHKGNITITFPKGLKETLLRAEILGEKDVYGSLVEFTVTPNKLMIKCANSFGKFEEFLPIDYDGKGFEFGIISEFLRKMLDAGIEKASIDLKGEHQIIRFDTKNFTHVCSLIAS